MIRIGTDIALITRFNKLSGHTEERVFTPFELVEAGKRARREEYLASRFAAKEAYSKALGTGFNGIMPRDIEIREEESGMPYINVNGERKEKVALSISHDGDYAVAFVVISDE